MRDLRPHLGNFALLALILLLLAPAIAQASGRVVAPRGWAESSAAAPEAQRRASRWKDALGLRLEQVVSAPDDDRFAETVAVFHRPDPVSTAMMQSEEAAVAELAGVVANVVGTGTPEASGLAATATGEQLIWARWNVDDLAYHCVLAPSGDDATVVVMAVRTRDLDTELARLETMASTMQGVTSAMPRFSLTAWRGGALLVWFALALALHAAMLRYVDREDDHSQAGRRASLITFGLVVVGTLVAYFGLAGRELAISHAGSSREGLTMWVAVAGMIVAGAHFMIAARFDRGVVQSAPESGVFASGVYSNADILRSSISRTNMRRGDLQAGEATAHAADVDSQPVGISGITIDPAERE